MKPIYRFTLDEATGVITRTEIAQYEERHWNNKETYYKYKDRNGVKYIQSYQIDKFKSGRVYTFNPDENHAKQIIKAELLARKDKAQKELERWQAVLEKM